MCNKMWIACLVYLAGAITIGATDLVVSAVQIPVALLLLFGGVLGFITGQWAWAWGLALGCSVFCAHAVAGLCGYQPPFPVQPNIFASFLAVIPALLGSFCGAGLHWAVHHGRAAAQDAN